MRERSLGITAVSVVSVVTGLYCLVAGIALLLAGAIGTAGNAAPGSAVLALGALYLGLSVAALFVGGALWLQRPLAWAGGMVVFTGLIVVNVVAAILGSSLLSIVAPVAASAGAMWYLTRPKVKAQLLGSPAVAEDSRDGTEAESQQVAETTA